MLKIDMLIHKLKRFFIHQRLPILTGILIGTSYIPFPPWAYLFCFIPLWFFWQKQTSYFQVFLGGWIAQFCLTLIGFNWVAYTLREFAFLPWPLAILGLLLFCSLANLYIPLAGVCWHFLRQKFSLRPSSSIFLLSIIVALFEAYNITLFKWNYGYPLFWARLPIYHMAEWIGFSGLSTLVILFNALIMLSYQQFKNSKQLSVLGLSLSLFFILNGVGYALSQNLPLNDDHARVQIVQANIGNQAKIAAEQGYGFRTEILNRYLRLTQIGLDNTDQSIDFSVWPETAFPDRLGNHFRHLSNQRKLRQFLKQNQTSLITGAYNDSPITREIMNSLFLLGPDGENSDEEYFKTILLMFGEYIPFADRFPILKTWFPQVPFFKRGPGPTLSQLGRFKIGPQICYESLFPHFTLGLANQGAEILVNITNDSWYGSWQQPYQHAWMTLARAIEVRRPLIRSTNTGISTVVLANGQVLDQSPIYQEWQHTFDIPFKKDPKTTFYQQAPWLRDIFLLLMVVVIFLYELMKTTPKKDE